MAHQSQQNAQTTGRPVLGISGVKAFARWLLKNIGSRHWPGARRGIAARKRHAEGQQLVREHLIIRSSAEPCTLQEAIVQGLALPYEKPTATAPDLFQGRVRPGEVRFGSGTRQATQFVSSMQILPIEAGGSMLTYRVDQWTLSDGIVAGIPQLKYLRRRIEDEARKVDAGIVANTVSNLAT